MEYSASSLNYVLKKKKKVIQAWSKGVSLDIDCKDTKWFVLCAYNEMIHSIVIGLVELVMD